MSSSSTGYEVQGSSLYGGSAKQARLASKKAMNQQPIPAGALHHSHESPAII